MKSWFLKKKIVFDDFLIGIMLTLYGFKRKIRKLSKKEKILYIIGIVLMIVLIYGLVTDSLFEWGRSTKALIVAAWFETIIFITNMTRTKLLLLAGKRWFMDHIVSRHLNDSFISKLSPAINLWWYRYTTEEKVRKFLPGFLVTIVMTIIVFLTNGIGLLASSLGINIANIVAAKVAIIGFFKGLWLAMGSAFKVLIEKWGSPFVVSYIYPLLELLALSWLIDWLKERDFVKKYITPWVTNKFLPWFNKYIVNKIDFIKLGWNISADFVEHKVQQPIKKGMDHMGNKAANGIRNKISCSTARGFRGCRISKEDRKKLSKNSTGRIFTGDRWNKDCDDYPP